MSIAAGLLLDFDCELGNTRTMLERVPEGKGDWRPHAKSMSLGFLSAHVATLPGWGLHTLETDTFDMGPNDWKPFVASSTHELVTRFDQEMAEFRTHLANVTDEEMMATWTFKWNGHTVFSMPRLQAIRGPVLHHMIHHRAQLSVYLRLLDIKVPGMYGPSADEM